MKLSSHDERFAGGESPVIITLDETLKSPLLYRKFTYLTTEFQLFLQYVPVLYWYPLDLLGTTTIDIDACIFSAAIRNTLRYTITTKGLLLKLLNELLGKNEEYSNLCESIYKLKSVDDQHWDIRKQRLKRLLIGLLDDELFFLELISTIDNYLPVQYISDRLRKSLSFIINMMLCYFKSNFNFQKLVNISINTKPKHEEEEKVILEKLTDEMKDNETIILKLIKKNAMFLKLASDRLKDNEQIVLEAIRQDGDALYYASNRLRNNEQLVLEADDIRYASKRLRNNEEFMIEAVKTNGTALKYAPARMKDNEEIVLSNPESFEFASKRLKDKESVVFEATKDSYLGIPFNFASKRLRNNEQFVLKLVSHNASILTFASDRLKDNEQIVFEAVKKHGLLLGSASERLKDNEKIVLQAVKQQGKSLQFASERLRNNQNLIIELLKHWKDLGLFEYCGKELRTIEFILYFIENNLSTIREMRRNCNNFFYIFKRAQRMRPIINE